MRWTALALLVVVVGGCKDAKAPKAKRQTAAKAQKKTVEKTPATPVKVQLPSPNAPEPTIKPLESNGPWPDGRTPPPDGEACADCHPDQVEGYAKTGMARSWYPPTKYPPIEDFDPKKSTIVHPITKVTYRAFVDDQGRWWQSESVGDYEKRVEVKFVVGSGNATRSYIGELENRLVELPLTWYVEKRIWDMSPGYEGKNHKRFSRQIQAPCMFCHNDLSPIRKHTVAAYHEPVPDGISCNRCHGDARAHMEQRLAGKGPPVGQADPTVINPKRLSPERQLQVCQQCHLSGKMRVLRGDADWTVYDVSQPLDEYMSIYIDADDKGPQFGIASHSKRLALSKCFQKSEGQLTCTKCHNPHKLEPALAKHDACVTCHKPTDCGDEHGKTEGKDCARCHMPHEGTNDIPHVSFTDHFIRRDPKADASPKTMPSMEVKLVDALAPELDDIDAKMRLGIAHAELARNEADIRHARSAIPLLKQALLDRPDHAEGWWQLARLLASMKQHPAAMDAFVEVERLLPNGALHRLDMANSLDALGDHRTAEGVLKAALTIRPDYREAWGNLANAYQKQGRLKEAEALYDKIEAAFPGWVKTANNRGYNAIQQENWAEAQKWFEAALARDGTNPMGHFNLGTLALKRNQEDTAKKHFRDALARDPDFDLAHWLIGRIALKAGKMGEARESLEAATKRNPPNPVMYLDLAQVHYKANNFDAARDVLMRGTIANPQNQLLTQAVRRLIAGLPPSPQPGQGAGTIPVAPVNGAPPIGPPGARPNAPGAPSPGGLPPPRMPPPRP